MPLTGKFRGGKMKRVNYLLVLAFFLFSSTTAWAAPPAYNWTGFYAGLQGIYATGVSDFDWPAYSTHTDHIIKGGMAGLVAGFNYQTPINVVVGIETDFNYGKLQGSSTCPGSSYECRTEVNWLGATRARVGYAVNRFLPYVAVGVTYSGAELFANETATGIEVENTKNDYLGWTPSIGVDFMITKNLIGSFEYAYYEFSTDKIQTTGVFTEQINNKFYFEAFKFGLIWKF